MIITCPGPSEPITESCFSGHRCWVSDFHFGLFSTKDSEFTMYVMSISYYLQLLATLFEFFLWCSIALGPVLASTNYNPLFERLWSVHFVDIFGIDRGNKFP